MQSNTNIEKLVQTLDMLCSEIRMDTCSMDECLRKGKEVAKVLRAFQTCFLNPTFEVVIVQKDEEGHNHIKPFDWKNLNP